jgi:hypothetical protein
LAWARLRLRLSAPLAAVTLSPKRVFHFEHRLLKSLI